MSLVVSGISRVNPLTPGGMTSLPSEMNHQVTSKKIAKMP